MAVFYRLPFRIAFSEIATYKKDVKNIDYNIYDTGHFVLEEEGDAIIAKIRSFMQTI